MKCNECGDEYDKSFDINNLDMSDPQQELAHHLEKCIRIYNKMNQDHPLSGDHFTGTCFVFFKGSKDMCFQIKELIKRPSSEESPDAP